MDEIAAEFYFYSEKERLQAETKPLEQGQPELNSGNGELITKEFQKDASITDEKDQSTKEPLPGTGATDVSEQATLNRLGGFVNQRSPSVSQSAFPTHLLTPKKAPSILSEIAERKESVDEISPYHIPSILAGSGSARTGSGLSLGSTLHSIPIPVLAQYDHRRISIVSPSKFEFDLRKSKISNLVDGVWFGALIELSGDLFISPSKRPNLWVSLLSRQKISIPSTLDASYDVQMASQSFTPDMVKNNLETGNFNVLLLILLTYLRSARLMDYTEAWSTEAWNAMFAVRIFMKSFIDTVSTEEIHNLMEADRLDNTPVYLDQKDLRPPTLPNIFVEPLVLSDKRLRADQLLMELVNLLIYVDPKDPNHTDFYKEALSFVIILFSTQLPVCTYDGTFAGLDDSVRHDNYFLDVFFSRFSFFGKGLFASLMDKYIHSRPSREPVPTGLVAGTLGYFFGSGMIKRDTLLVIGGSSLLLLLLLIHQPRKDVFWMLAGNLVDGSPVKSELSKIISTASSSSPIQADFSCSSTPYSILIDFKELYDCICSHFSVETSVLLLLTLILRNRSYRTFVLSRSDPDLFCLPILKLLFEAVESKAMIYSVYASLTVLLLLTEDEMFLESVQKVFPSKSYNLGWYAEKDLSEKSLNDIMLLVIIRCIQANMSILKDSYVHVCCIGILVNLSRAISGISLFASHKLVGLFEALCKRYAKEMAFEEMASDSVGLTSIVTEDLLCLVMDVLITVLSSPSNALRNAHLLYSLLHKRKLFERESGLGRLLAINSRMSLLQGKLGVVVEFVQERVEASLDTKLATTDSVMEVIVGALKSKESMLILSPAAYSLHCSLQFVVEGDVEENKREGSSMNLIGDSDGMGLYLLRFSLPYCWSLICKNVSIYWQDDVVGSLFDITVV